MIAVLTLLAGFLRLYRLEPSLQFLGDQGRDALVMYRLLAHGDFPFIGPITSVGGFYLGPLYYYLMAPFLWLARFNPVGPAAATAVLGIVTVPLLYWVAKKLFSHRVGLWAAGLYALAYIPISETRSAWNPNLMPLAALGIIYGFQTRNLLLAAVSLGAALQLHYMIVFLAPVILWQVFLVRKKVKELLIALVILLLMMTPLILFEVKNNWLNVKGLMEFLTKHQYGSLNLWEVAKNTVGRSEQAIGMVLGFGRDFSSLRTWVTRVFLLLLLIFFKRVKFLGIYLLSTIAMLAVYQDNIYPHYLGFLFPAVFILTAAILSRMPKLFLPAFAVLFLAYNLPPINSLLRQNGNLANVQKTAKFISEDIRLNNYRQVNLALIDGTRDYPAMNFRYFLTVKGIEVLGIDQYPQTRILYLISPYRQTEILQQPMWEIQALLPAEVVESWEWPDRENIYKIKRL
ncbi:hypothetical protein A3I57_02270 [Candidatus Beckwithbacteria bacterium RIFCSPLOWO2_02_FULL_47_23]|uniref:Uncharacterized protein n=2 Tax=Candidatus Beckwithiibacteriota TaxID=1752726 RepID=A0A1F5E1L2_9BACT|nr:MAG: hypothetical protein A3E73_01765 [Candidatus Beckwithbacteria bacterium RIFCSPHIGHO2_12_FULL_47_17]OGD61262.1 MAG: hypothetical protein A3I57_02270 [Candidatus Beckwithbacteria bacterium RIFCSPLOWO2_02_FULL_47_23]